MSLHREQVGTKTLRIPLPSTAKSHRSRRRADPAPAPAEGKATAFFGYRATEARCVSENDTGKAATKLSEFQQYLTNWMARSPGGRTLDLRVLCWPEERRVDLVILGKVARTTTEEAREEAKAFSRELETVLGLNSFHSFEAVKGTEGFEDLLSPFPVRALCEIRRAPFSVRLDTGRVYSALFRPLGPASSQRMEYPLRLMLQQSGPTMVSACVRPVELPHPGLTQTARDQLKEIRRLIDGGALPVGFGSDLGEGGVSEIAADELYAQLDQLRRSVRQLGEGDGFFGRLMLAGAKEPLSSALLWSIASIFFDYGRHEVRSYESEEERSLGIVRLRRLDVCDALEEGLPESSGLLLRHYFDRGDGEHLFQLPRPIESGVPGMETNRLRVLPPSRKLRAALGARNQLQLAEAVEEKTTVPLHLKAEDLRTHLYVCGQTGTGKSTLLLRLAISMIEEGHGLCLIDPHGDLVEAILERVPGHRVPDVVLFDPTNDPTAGLNLLENSGREEERDLIVQEFVAMMFKLFATDTMGPMFERAMRNSLKLLMVAGETLDQAPRLYGERSFLEHCLGYLGPTDWEQEVRMFWKEFVSQSGEKQAEYSGYYVSKLDRFFSDAILRRVVSKKRSSFDLFPMMHWGGILLASLPKGSLGEVSANLLGMILSAKIQVAALKRTTIPAEMRKQFFFVVDEFQSFVSSASSFSYATSERSFSSLLSEARKYGLGLVLANQYISQLDRGTSEAVFGNTGSQIAFRVGREDAEFLTKHFSLGDLSVEDFRYCPNFHGYAQFLLDGTPHLPCTIRTVPPERIMASPDVAARIRSGKSSRFLID